TRNRVNPEPGTRNPVNPEPGTT
ncbi:MAG: hypothetical protein V7647_1506, partial [Acidobacteriota bacterium]